jgi:hypothetical protein
MSIRFLNVISLLVSLFFVSCMSDIELSNISGKISIDPSLVLPLGKVTVNLGDIIAANDSDKVLSTDLAEITYQRTDSLIFSYPKIDIAGNIPVVTKSIDLAPNSPIYPVPIPANTTLPSVTINQTFDLGINGAGAKERIDSIKVSRAVLSIKVSTNVANLDPSKLKLTVTFGNGKMRKLDGTPSVLTIQPTGFNAPEQSILQNFVIDVSGGATSIPVKLELEAQTGSNPILLDKNSKLDIEFSFNKLDWQVLYGQFDMSSLATSVQEIPVGINTNILNGAFKFSNPQINISAVSNVGMKLGFKLDYFKSRSNLSSVYAHFDGNETLTQDFATRPFIPGETVNVNFKTFDRIWGETDKLFEIMPTFFEFKATPFADVTDRTPSYLTPDGQIKVYLKTTIPMQFNAGSYYQYVDTINNIFDTTSKIVADDVLNKVEKATFVFSILNNLPVKSILSFRFLDAMGVEVKMLDSFNKKYEIAAGKVSLKGKIIPGTVSQQLTISVTKDELFQIKKANNLEFKVRVEGADVDSKILFSTSNSLDLKLGLLVKTNLDQ